MLRGNSSRGGGKESGEEKVPKPGWGELLRLCLAHESRVTRARVMCSLTWGCGLEPDPLCF